MLRRLCLALAALCSLAALSLCGAWLLGRIVTDRWLITELLFWVPSLWYLVPAVALAAIAVALARPRADAGLLRRWSRRLARATLAGAILCALLMGLVEWRLPRALFMPARKPADASLHLIHWNLCSVDESFRPEVFSQIPGARDTDVFFLTSIVDSRRLNTAAAALGPEFTTLRLGTFAVISRVPILRASVTSLGIPPPESLLDGSASSPSTPSVSAHAVSSSPLTQRIFNRLSRSVGIRRRALDQPDPGAILFIELDTTRTLGRATSVWFIDLPSSPLAPRYALAQAAAARIAQLRDTGQIPGPPHPDVLLGDFNIPRGSASLDVLTAQINPGLTHAYNQAAYGPIASWPRARPLLLIDHTFVAPPLRATRYRIADPWLGEHAAQVVELSADPPGR